MKKRDERGGEVSPSPALKRRSREGAGGGVPAGATPVVERVPDRAAADRTDGCLTRAERAITALRAGGAARDEILIASPRAIGEALGWDAGMIWTPASGGAYLVCRTFWGAGEIANGDFARASREMRFEPGLGLVGRVWEKREWAWIEDVTALPDYVRVGPARREGLRSTFIATLETGGDVLGVVEFYARGPRFRDPELVSAMLWAVDGIARSCRPPAR